MAGDRGSHTAGGNEQSGDASTSGEVGGVAALLPLLREVNDLKRIRSAGRSSTWATRCFARSWKRILGGEDIEEVALHEAARAVAAARLADLDSLLMQAAGVHRADALQVLGRSLDAAGAALDAGLRQRMHAALESGLDSSAAETLALPSFADLLIQQPRAGATRPGVGRVVLEPAEMHGDHCAIVAVNGVLCAPLFGASPGDAFLSGLTHHFHNAWWPDAGDAGDNLVGEHLAPALGRLRERAIAQLPEEVPELRERARASLEVVYRADTPWARAFQTADVLDRVLEMEWHARSASFTLGVALHDMDIVHPGPVQTFQQQIVRAAGLG